MIAKTYRYLAKHLAEKINIVVNFVKGACPSTDGKEITLPEELAEQYVNATLGALLHETAHIRHSDFQVGRYLNFYEQFAWNVVEDIRVDHLVVKKYPNARSLLKILITDAIATKKELLNKEPLGAKILKGLVFVSYGLKPEDIYTDTNAVKKILELEDYVEKAKACKDSQEALVLAKEILSKILGALVEEKPKTPKGKGQPNPDGKPSDDSDSEENTDQENDDEDDQDGEEETDQEDSGKDSNGDSKEGDSKSGNSNSGKSGKSKMQKKLDKIQKLEKELSKAQEKEKEVSGKSDGVYGDYKTNRRKRRTHETKLRRMKWEKEQAEQNGKKTLAKEIGEKIAKKEEVIKELFGEKEKIEDKNQIVQKGYQEAQKTRYEIQKERDQLKGEFEKFLEGGFSQDPTKDVKIMGFQALDAEKILSTDPDCRGDLEELIKEALIAKSQKEEQEENGSNLNFRNIGDLYTNPDILFTETYKKERKTFISFVIDGSGSMGYSQQESSRATLACYGVGVIAQALKKAIQNNTPADFNIYAFGNNVELLVTDSEMFDAEKLLGIYDRKRDKGGTELAKAINKIAEDLNDRSDVTDRYIILLTDAEVNERELQELRNNLNTADAKWIAISVKSSQHNPDLEAELFRDLDITSKENAEEVIRQALSETAGINL